MAAISIRTEIPGPRSRALMRRRAAAVPRGVAHAAPVFAASADGVRVTDVDGNVYLDFAGGIGVMNVGHSAPSVVAAVGRQAERLTHVCFAVQPYESYVALAERLAALTPGRFAKKTLLVNIVILSSRRKPGPIHPRDGFLHINPYLDNNGSRPSPG